MHFSKVFDKMLFKDHLLPTYPLSLWSVALTAILRHMSVQTYPF